MTTDPASTIPAPPVRYPGIIDIAHMDADVLADAPAQGFGACVLKTCTGVGCPDSKFSARFAEALSLGLLVSGYAFLTGQHSGADQWADFRARWDAACAAHALNPQALPVWCDFESNPSGTPASPQHARDFLAAGRADGYRVGLYGGSSHLSAVFQDASDPIGSYPLWLAQYSNPEPHTPPPWRANGWTLWQYTDQADGPSDRIAYPRSHCDRSCYRGTVAQCALWWAGLRMDGATAPTLPAHP